MGEYYFATTGITGAISAQNLLTIENPSGSAVNVLITNIRIHSALSILSTSVFSHKIGRSTAVPSGGSTQTAQKQLSSDSSPTAIIRTNSPTATFATGLIMSGTPGIAITAAGIFIPRVTEITNDHPILLVPNEGLIVGVEVNLITWTHFVSIAWTEN